MKKSLKIMFMVGIALFCLTGCQIKELKAVYDKMTINENMVGYRASIDVTGTYDGRRLNSRVYLSNYLNKQFEVSSSEIQFTADGIVTEDTTLVYSNDKMYKQQDDMQYVETTETTPYLNTDVYVDSLINNKKATKLSNETIGDNSYSVYQLTLTKDQMNKILNYTVAPVQTTKDSTAKVYVDGDNYIYQIIYTIAEDDDNSFDLAIVFDQYNGTTPIEVSNTLTTEAE